MDYDANSCTQPNLALRPAAAAHMKGLQGWVSCFYPTLSTYAFLKFAEEKTAALWKWNRVYSRCRAVMCYAVADKRAASGAGSHIGKIWGWICGISTDHNGKVDKVSMVAISGSRLHTMRIMAHIAWDFLFHNMLAMKKSAGCAIIIQEYVPVMTAIAEGINRFTFS